MIESLQREIERPDLETPKIVPPMKIKVQSSTPEMAQKPEQMPEVLERVETTPEPEPVPEPAHITPPPVDPNLKKFDELVAKIKDRNAQLGECFTNNITYVSYEDETLTWESCADEEWGGGHQATRA